MDTIEPQKYGKLNVDDKDLWQQMNPTRIFGPSFMLILCRTKTKLHKVPFLFSKGQMDCPTFITPTWWWMSDSTTMGDECLRWWMSGWLMSDSTRWSLFAKPFIFLLLCQLSIVNCQWSIANCQKANSLNKMVFLCKVFYISLTLTSNLWKRMENLGLVNLRWCRSA